MIDILRPDNIDSQIQATNNRVPIVDHLLKLEVDKCFKLLEDQAKRRLQKWGHTSINDDWRTTRRWIMRRAGYGESEICGLFQAHHVSVDHLQTCFGAEIDLLRSDGN